MGRGDYLAEGWGAGVPEVEAEVGAVGDGEVGGDRVAGCAGEVHVWYAWVRPGW